MLLLCLKELDSLPKIRLPVGACGSVNFWIVVLCASEDDEVEHLKLSGGHWRRVSLRLSADVVYKVSN